MRVTVSNRQRKIKLETVLLRKASLKILAHLKLDRAELSLAFVSPSKMSELNSSYRNIQSTTDVLSFPLYEFNGSPPFEFPAHDTECLLGDIVIDPIRASEQAKEYGAELGEELQRLLVHGILHLLGYDHEAGSAKAKSMRKMEKELLALL